jgi:hypothetical protein
MPAGTQVLLLRQALHVSPDGTLLPTRLVESVQVRIMRDTTSEGQSKKEAQAFFEIELHPSRYARGEDGLGVAANDEKFYPIFQTFERDEFDNPQEPRTNAVERGSTCLGCHRLAGIEGMNSLTRSFTARGPRPEPISVIDGREQFGVDGFKGDRRDWGLLQGMLEAHRGASTQPTP